MDIKKRKLKTLKSIGRIIKTKRKKAGMSQTELADSLGVTKATICKYENGIIDMPPSVLPLISESCNFKLSDYIDTTEKANKAAAIIDSYYHNTEFGDRNMCVRETEMEYNINEETGNKFLVDYFVEFEDNADLVISLGDSVKDDNKSISNTAGRLIIETMTSHKSKYLERLKDYFKNFNIE